MVAHFTTSPEAKFVSEHLDKIRIQNIIKCGEAEEHSPSQIEELKRTILTLSPNLKIHPSTYDQDVYMRYLRACDFDIERSATMYIKNCSLRHNSVPGIRELSQPSLFMENIYNIGFKTVLKPRDALGRKLLLYRTGQWDTKKVTAELSIASMMILLDELMVSEDTQRNGTVYIADHTGFSMTHARASSKECIVTSIRMMEDSFPLKCEEYHFVNCSTAFSIAMRFMKTFMSEKLKSKLFIHNSIESFHAHVHPSLLPKRLGGMWPDDDHTDTEIFNSLQSKDDYYREFLKYGRTLDEDNT